MSDDLNALRAKLARTPATDAAARIEIESALIVALVEELEDAEADQLLERVVARMGDARSEVAFRRQLAWGLNRVGALDRVIVQLRACEQLAYSMGSSTLPKELAAEIAAVAARQARQARPREHAVEQIANPEIASGRQLALARQTTGDAAIEHARKSLAHAYDAIDPQLVADATGVLCELLVERGELREARRLLEQRPLVGADGRAARALYDEIRRRQGESVPEPPEEPDEHVHVSPAVHAYVSRSPNPARSIAEGGLPAAFKIREWAAATLTTPEDLESQRVFGPVRSFWCACGRLRGREYMNLTCPRCGVESVHASARRTRTACITLGAPVVHPWYAATAGALLDLTLEQVLALPIVDLRARLEAVDLDAMCVRFKHEIVTAPKARLADQAGRRLAIADAFRNARAPFGTTPSSIVLDVILVVPPAGDLGIDREAVRAAYARILEEPRDASAVGALFAACDTAAVRR